MNRTCYKTSGYPKGFSLAELITALVIGSMVLVVMLSIYNHAEQTAAAISRKVESSHIAGDVLQMIAEDVDKLMGSGSNVKVTVENKFDSDGYSTARLVIEKFIYNKRNQKQPFERIVWQTDYEFSSDTPGLVLYRSHTGMNLEDKLLDEQRADWEADYNFVPVCRGVTYFRIQVPREDMLYERWTRNSLPPGIIVTISFAEPFDTPLGTLDVFEEEKIVRSVAIDRSKLKRFRIAPIDFGGPGGEEEQAEEETDEAAAEDESEEGIGQPVKPDTRNQETGRTTRTGAAGQIKEPRQSDRLKSPGRRNARPTSR